MNVDDLAKYAKVVHDREGRPLGIQISDDIPDDNAVIARGGRKGDIIKAINGKPVTSMSDVRRIVREDYNAGVEEFTVTYERDGVPGTKIFKAPAKKKTDK
jgi:membrane-associated protease RseP (regulator of RpoE activity)